jgi:hypothetical protein
MLHATVGELKEAVESVLRNTNRKTNNFLMMEIDDLEGRFELLRMRQYSF